VVDAINALYELQSEAVDKNHNPRATFAGCLLRLAGHDFMDYRVAADGTMTGGSDGCLNMDDPDNKGLPECIQNLDIASAYGETCDRVSLADFVVIAAEAVTARASTNYNPNDYFADGTLAARYRAGFKSGRKTETDCD